MTQNPMPRNYSLFLDSHNTHTSEFPFMLFLPYEEILTNYCYSNEILLKTCLKLWFKNDLIFKLVGIKFKEFLGSLSIQFSWKGFLGILYSIQSFLNLLKFYERLIGWINLNLLNFYDCKLN